MRQDGTRTYYFTTDELTALWSDPFEHGSSSSSSSSSSSRGNSGGDGGGGGDGCDVIECKMCTVINRNRKKQLDMKRVWVQGRFRRRREKGGEKKEERKRRREKGGEKKE
jgi:hypothetical protein